MTPSCGFLYALSGGATVFAFSIDANSGALTAIHGSPFMLSSATDNAAIDPSGQFLYAAYANAIAGFSINASTGTLTAFTAPTAPAPGATVMAVVKSSQ
jgi:6-phosphogluconolactonase (cycloisomerase 2 family)